MRMKILTILLIVNFCSSSPIFDPKNRAVENAGGSTPPVPEGLCPLPEELGFSGFATLMEDCQTLDLYGEKIPTEIYSIVGSSVYVCCPNREDEDAIVFPDALEVEEGDNDEGDYVFEGGDVAGPNPEDNCKQVPGTTCTNIDQCSDEDFNREEPPIFCGHTVDTGKDKVCCKTVKPRTIKPIAKKYGSKNYECNDFNKQCQVFAKNDPTACTSPKHPSFNFMKMGCMKTCNQCGTKGCVDEFEKCVDWTLQGHCVRYPDFMLFNCRESCGACGFRSPLNSEKQVVNDASFTDTKDPKFFCGEGKAKKDLSPRNGLSSKKKRSPQEKEATKVFNPADDIDNLEFFSYSTNGSSITCGSTIVNDRFIVFAAHCQSQFQNPDPRKNIRTIILRDDTEYKENIEIRRVFVHPNFYFPSLYNDIAVAELGRRIIYDYEKFGDTPACISSGKDIIGKAAISQGYGFTEKGTVSTELLEGNVTIISNPDCEAWLKGNVTTKRNLNATYSLQLNNGISDSLVCTVGHYNETLNIYSGPCQGDSGGPLYVNFGETPGKRVQTLEGIVSGGIGCGRNIPAWYTRVSSFRPWIDCIIREVSNGGNKEEVEKSCQKFVGPS